MSKFTDQNYLKTDQYKDATNLNARVLIHQRFSTNPYGWMNWVLDRILALPAKAKILELGCGPGYLWKENASRIPSTWDITLSDLSSGMLDSAWRNLVVTGRNYKFKEIDAQEIPFEDETFDAVIANHMLYHVPLRIILVRPALSRFHRTGSAHYIYSNDTPQERVDLSGDALQFVAVEPDVFFGYRCERLAELPVLVADEPKSILDSLSLPQHAGGVSEVAKALQIALSQDSLEMPVLLEYAERLQNASLRSRRLGIYLNYLDNPLAV